MYFVSWFFWLVHVIEVERLISALICDMLLGILSATQFSHVVCGFTWVHYTRLGNEECLQR